MFSKDSLSPGRIQITRKPGSIALTLPSKPSMNATSAWLHAGLMTGIPVGLVVLTLLSVLPMKPGQDAAMPGFLAVMVVYAVTMTVLFRSFAAPASELVTLHRDDIRWRPGPPYSAAPFAWVNNGWYGIGYRLTMPWQDVLAHLVGVTTQTILREAIADLAEVDAPAGRRLLLFLGGQPKEVGIGLTASERAWLVALLKRWREQVAVERLLD